MIRLWFVAAISIGAGSFPANASESACDKRSKSPIESANLIDIRPFNNAVTFSAAPHLDSLGRSWAIRIVQPTYFRPAKIDVVQLRQHEECNSFYIENRWNAEINSEEYESLVEELSRLALPTINNFKPQKSVSARIGGTGLILHVQTDGWEVSRRLNYNGTDGGALSSVIRNFVSRNVPSAVLPTAANWSSAR